jgi:hypothetical protein
MIYLIADKDYKAKMFQRKVGWGWGKFADGLNIFSVSQGSHRGGNRRGVTGVYTVGVLIWYRSLSLNNFFYLSSYISEFFIGGSRGPPRTTVWKIIVLRRKLFAWRSFLWKFSYRNIQETQFTEGKNKNAGSYTAICLGTFQKNKKNFTYSRNTTI